ncbi:MAG: 5-formyltetrahydrofolate cyclo-ligase [Thermoprotei archaeon]|nr:MAG: 5-formyltetrahydrofolate cyclo-ligase [Thermoprotei archaeon]
MSMKERIREAIWRELRRVAKPDSRFHYDFSSFIPDFEGSDKCARAIRSMEIYKRAKLLMITPDNCLEVLREYCIIDSKRFIMPTYGIKRGFLLLSRELVPFGKEDFAATLDGAEKFGKYLSLREIKTLEKIDVMITGASVVSIEGVRYGKGHGYFDLEWGIFRELGLVNDETPIIAVVHDCQVVDVCIEAKSYDTLVDYIVTPTRVIKVKKKRGKPKGIIWSHLSHELIEEIPALRELMKIKGIEYPSYNSKENGLLKS